MAERLGINIEITGPPDRRTNHQHFYSHSLTNGFKIKPVAVRFDALCYCFLGLPSTGLEVAPSQES